MFGKVILVTALVGVSLAMGQQSIAGSIEAAISLIESCDEDLKGEMVKPFDSPSRTDWHYFPRDRDGVPIGKLNEDQVAKLRALLGTALSKAGMEKVDAVIRLEQVLFDESQAPVRDPGKFQIVIWGSPSSEKEWGWRFEGHHMSVNVTLRGDETLSVTPTFFGANPATVGSGEWEGFRALPAEEDLGREFMLSLPKEQREMAIVDGKMGDVVGGGEAQIHPNVDQGLRAASLDDEDKAILHQLIETYSNWFQPEVATKLGLDSKRLAEEEGLVFCWMGGLGEGDVLHTYRITGKSFDIQYANHQSNANHVHTLFRTVGHDFGE